MRVQEISGGNTRLALRNAFSMFIAFKKFIRRLKWKRFDSARCKSRPNEKENRIRISDREIVEIRSMFVCLPPLTISAFLFSLPFFLCFFVSLFLCFFVSLFLCFFYFTCVTEAWRFNAKELVENSKEWIEIFSVESEKKSANQND